MKFILMCVLVTCGSFTAVAKTAEKKKDRKAASIPIPLLHSISSYRAVLDMLAKDRMIHMLQIKSLRDGKIELVDNDGKCTAIAYEVSSDALGLHPEAKVMANAMVECD